MNSIVSIILPDRNVVNAEFNENPLIGQVIAIEDLGVFRITEVGWRAKEGAKALPFAFVEEIEGLQIPPSGRYDPLNNYPGRL